MRVREKIKESQGVGLGELGIILSIARE